MNVRRDREEILRQPADTPHKMSASDEAAGAPEWRDALAGDREAFNRLVSPHVAELLGAARRELRYRVALGELRPDDLNAEELVGETLARAWRDRHRRPALLGTRAWLLALLFRVSEGIARREARFRKLAPVSLEAKPPPAPFYDDDESFYEWYQPDEMTRWEDLVAEPTSLTPEEVVESEERLRSLAPRERLVYVLHDIHRLSTAEVAQAAGIEPREVLRLLAEARRHAARTKA
jgi:RNA polymerase sigma-70 factor (ECF subfamily)